MLIQIKYLELCLRHGNDGVVIVIRITVVIVFLPYSVSGVNENTENIMLFLIFFLFYFQSGNCLLLSSVFDSSIILI